MLGKNISELRKNLGISQEKLSEEIGVSRQTISNWELGETYPNSEQLILLSKTLNISTDELIGNEFSLLNEKIQTTENFIKKEKKLNKILFIIIYFLILITLIILMIVLFTKKDFTKDYQTEFVCTLNGVDYQVYLEDSDGKYLLHNGEENYLAGDNLSDIFKSLDALKQFYIKNGGTCR